MEESHQNEDELRKQKIQVNGVLRTSEISGRGRGWLQKRQKTKAFLHARQFSADHEPAPENLF